MRNGRLVLAELKRSDGRISTAQHEWLNALADVPGIEVYLWTPDDWPEIQSVLQR